MALTRRELLKNGAAMVALGLTVPTFLANAVEATQKLSAVARRQTSRPTLLVVQLSGGNDGLNTVVPYADPRYYELRPTLGIPAEQVIALDDRVGLHPSLAPLKGYFDRGKLAVIQGVGYPNPNRSHFRSMEIWHTANPETFERTGWLGRYLDACGCGRDNPVGALNVGDVLNRSFWTEMTLVPAVGSVATFHYQTDPRHPRDRGNQIKALQNIYDYAGQFRPYEEAIRRTTLSALAGADELKRIAATYQPTVEYPATPFANHLKMVAQVMAGDLGTRIFYLSLGGFDTHANQPNLHAQLLDTLASGLAALMRDLENQGRADDLVVMTFSEFGRRPIQNASGGTDHGTAEPMLMLGGAVNGGLYNTAPNLQDLPDGDLRVQADFRGVYATVLQDWFGADPTPIVGAGASRLPVLA